MINPAGDIQFYNSSNDLDSSGNLALAGNISSNGTGSNYFAGNVGIGTTDPLEKLAVQGNISTSGNINPQTAGVKITATVVDSNGAGAFNSSYIGADGFARIAYKDDTNQDLKFVQCTNADCSTKIITTVDSQNDVGGFLSMALGAGDLARISYIDKTNNDLKFAQCTNADCSGKNITIVDAGYVDGYNTSLALGPDGFARIAYYDNTVDRLKFVQCTNIDCSAKKTGIISSNDGWMPSLALGADGFARIAYTAYDDNDASTIKYAVCNDDACSSPVLTTIATENSGTDSLSLEAISLGLASGNIPKIAYSTDYQTRLAICEDEACGNIFYQNLADNAASGMYDISLKVGTDNLAVVTFINGGGADSRFDLYLAQESREGDYSSLGDYKDMFSNLAAATIYGNSEILNKSLSVGQSLNAGETAFQINSGSAFTGNLFLAAKNSGTRMALDSSGNLEIIGSARFNGVRFPDSVYFSPQYYFDNSSAVSLPTTWATSIDSFIAISATSTVPFTKVALSLTSNSLVSDFIEVNAGDSLYGEIWAMRNLGATGTAGTLYYGVERYDKDKRPIASNSGTSYFAASALTVPATGVWTKYSGTTDLPLTHTPYSGSDGGPVRFVRVRIYVNLSAGTIPTYWGGIILRKVQTFADSGNSSFIGNLGLGVSSPAQKLDIANGALRFSFASSPTAATAALAGAGAGALTNGAYTYKVTFVNAIGETAAGTVSNTVTVADATSNGKINLTAIPVSTDSTITSRKIYRTAAGGSTYKLLATIADNTATAYTDNIADGSLGATAPTVSSISGSFYSGAIRVMTMDSSGNLGIGTTAPTNLLSFGGNSAQTVWMERHTTANTAGNNLTLEAGGATSLATDKNGGGLYLKSGIATGSGSSSIYFQTVAAGTAGSADRTAATAMTIFGNGNIAIATSTAAYTLDVGGGASGKNIRGYDVYTHDGAATSFSDSRLKDIQGNYDRGLSEILSLNPILYNYKKGNELGLDAGSTNVGLVAQDVQKYIPEAVETGQNGFLTLSSAPILYAAINAIKEQQGEINALRLALDNDGTISASSTDALVTAGTAPSSLIQTVKNALASLGIAVENGVASLKELVVGKVRMDKMEMVDKGGNIWCVSLDENGEWIKIKGECNVANPNPESSSGGTTSDNTGGSRGINQSTSVQESSQGQALSGSDAIGNDENNSKKESNGNDKSNDSVGDNIDTNSNNNGNEGGNNDGNGGAVE